MASQPHLSGLDQFIVGKASNNLTYKTTFDGLKHDLGYIISETEPNDPIDGTLWINISADRCPPELYIYSECSGTGIWYPIIDAEEDVEKYLEYDADGNVYVSGHLYIVDNLDHRSLPGFVPRPGKYVEVDPITGNCTIYGSVFTGDIGDVEINQSFPDWNPIGFVEQDASESINVRGRLVVAGDIIFTEDTREFLEKDAAGNVYVKGNLYIEDTLHQDDYLKPINELPEEYIKVNPVSGDVYIDGSVFTSTSSDVEVSSVPPLWSPTEFVVADVAGNISIVGKLYVGGDVFMSGSDFDPDDIEFEVLKAKDVCVDKSTLIPGDVLQWNGYCFENRHIAVEYLLIDQNGNVYVPGNLYVWGDVDKNDGSQTPVPGKHQPLFLSDAHIEGDVFAAGGIVAEAYVNPERWKPIARAELTSTNGLSIPGKLVVRGKIYTDLPASAI